MNTSHDITAWQHDGVPEAVRIESFRFWARGELAKRLCWPGDPAQRMWQMGCAVNVIEEFAGVIGRRGHYLAPDALATLITERLDDVGNLQKRRPVMMIYSFLRKALERYLTDSAEEIKYRATRHYSHGSQFQQAVGQTAHARSMVEVLAEKVLAEQRERVALTAYRNGVRRAERRQKEFRLFDAAVA